jgi:hypothetical protein
MNLHTKKYIAIKNQPENLDIAGNGLPLQPCLGLTVGRNPKEDSIQG